MQTLKLEDPLNKEIKLPKKEEIKNQINSYRKSLNDSMKLIDEEFKQDSNNFKLREDLLNKDQKSISDYISKLIEQKGILELESEKSNIN